MNIVPIARIFRGHSVEMFNIDGILYFNPYHVSACIGMETSSVRHHLAKMNHNQVKKLTNSDVHIVDIRKFNNAGESFVTESGLYQLIFKSRKPEAMEFTNWVTDEVLPAIRKTGSYTITHRRARKVEHRKPFMVKIPASALPPEEVTPSREDVHKAAADFMLLMDVNYKLGFDRNIAAIAANQVTARLTGVNMLRLLGHTQLESKIQEIFFTPTELGTKIGASGQEFNILLRDAGLQEKLDARWLPTKEGEEYSRIFDVGKRQKHGAAVQQVRWSLRVLELLQD